jgi:hypothetical protein
MEVSLHQELFNLNLHSINGGLELRSFIGGNRSGNHWARDTTGTSQGYFAVGYREMN